MKPWKKHMVVGAHNEHPEGKGAYFFMAGFSVALLSDDIGAEIHYGDMWIYHSQNRLSIVLKDRAVEWDVVRL